MSRLFPNAVRSCTSFFDFVLDLMGDGLRFLCLTVRSHSALSAEVLFLRKQLAFYEERERQPRRLTNSARLSLVLWSQLFDWKSALVIVKPETLIGWHRRGFKLFWKWKSRVGRPRLPENIRKLITRMALETPTWGQARVTAELSVKLGIHGSPRTVRAYWPPESGPRGAHKTSSQHWKMFVRNHAQSIVACDFLVVITASIPNSVRLSPHGTWDQAHRALQSHRAPNGRVDLAAVSRGNSNRSCLPLSRSRPRLHLLGRSG